MFFKRHRGERGAPERIYIHSDVLQESARLVEANSAIEVGGKLLGYRIRRGSAAPDSPYGRAIEAFWSQTADTEAFLLVGSIGSGPRAKASATSLHPDGEFQESVFRQIERAEPEIEHLGTWHSHHPNGLREFSDGDVRGYAATVADHRYNEDAFISGLCFEPAGLSTGVFDMYTRTAPGAPKRLGGDSLHVVDVIPSLQPAIAEAEARTLGGHRSGANDHAGDAHAAIEDALRAAVGGEQVQRIIDSSGTGWVVTWPRGPERQAVVMYASGPPTPRRSR